MSENLKKFLELVSADKDLDAKALACNELGEEEGKLALIALAKENGIELTLERVRGNAAAPVPAPDPPEPVDSEGGGAGV